jgi:transcription antitermination factor NusG
MATRSIEHFVPSYEVIRHWKDRKKRLSLPLFPGYVFVQIALDQRLSVLVIPGAVRLVGIAGHPVSLDDEEIEKLRSVLTRGIAVKPHPYLAAGRKLRVVRGPLAGLKGVLIRRKGQVRLLISIDAIRHSATIEVDSADVEPLANDVPGQLPRELQNHTYSASV